MSSEWCAPQEATTADFEKAEIVDYWVAMIEYHEPHPACALWLYMVNSTFPQMRFSFMNSLFDYSIFYEISGRAGPFPRELRRNNFFQFRMTLCIFVPDERTIMSDNIPTEIVVSKCGIAGANGSHSSCQLSPQHIIIPVKYFHKLIQFSEFRK